MGREKGEGKGEKEVKKGRRLMERLRKWGKGREGKLKERKAKGRQE